MKQVAVIPARGGSQGVPRKNLLTIAGRPLLGHAISCCQLAGCDEVIVSTDCRLIRAEAERWGASVVTRHEELAGSDSTSQDALRHALQGIECDAVAFVQCTSPMLTADDVRGCLDKLPGFDLVICCVPFDGIVLGSDGQPRNFRIGHSPRRQDRERQWLISGNCWAFRPGYLQWDWMTGTIGVHEASYPHRLEIDEPADVELAEAVLENLFHRHRQHDLPDGGDWLRSCGAVA